MIQDLSPCGDQRGQLSCDLHHLAGTGDPAHLDSTDRSREEPKARSMKRRQCDVEINVTHGIQVKRQAVGQAQDDLRRRGRVMEVWLEIDMNTQRQGGDACV